jgi:hypothetical protein
MSETCLVLAPKNSARFGAGVGSNRRAASQIPGAIDSRRVEIGIRVALFTDMRISDAASHAISFGRLQRFVLASGCMPH